MSGGRGNLHDPVADHMADEARRDRAAVIVQHRNEAPGIKIKFIDEQVAHLGIAVLLDDENKIVLFNEVLDLPGEREGLDAHAIEREAVQVVKVVQRLDGPQASGESL